MIEWLSWKVNRNLIVALNNNTYILISPYLKNPLIFNLPRRGYYPEQRFWHTTLAYINFPSQQPGPGPESCRAKSGCFKTSFNPDTQTVTYYMRKMALFRTKMWEYFCAHKSTSKPSRWELHLRMILLESKMGPYVKKWGNRKEKLWFEASEVVFPWNF